MARTWHEDGVESAYTTVNHMATLTLHFRRDFRDDAVVVRVNGRRRYSNPALSTKLLLDVAEVLELKVPDGEVTVSVVLTDRDLKAQAKYQAKDTVHVEVWCVDDKLELRRPPAAPAYL